MTGNLEGRIGEIADWADSFRDAATLRRALAELGCHIYGGGGFGREVAAAAEAQGYRVHGFIDTFMGGGELVAGKPCHRPDEITSAAAADSVLIIAVNNFKTPVDEIVSWARGVPFADIIFVAELPDVLGTDLGHYWQASRRLIRDNAAQLERLQGMLADDRSREILRALAVYRITGRPEDHPPVDRSHQYFPVDLPLATNSLCVVDCGAFPGDMLAAVANAGLTLENWYAFEPDAANFRQLRDVAAATGGFGSASLFPCGVGDNTGLIRFAEGAADASRAIDEAGGSPGGNGVVVPIVRVADVVHASRVDMVKLDVEGFEAQAIDGMVELLALHRPRLAMAIYHKPSDLWELAFKIDALFPNARYAIRQHGYNGYDTVLYVDL